MNKIELKPNTVARIKGLLKKYSIKRVQMETGCSFRTIHLISKGQYTVPNEVAPPEDETIFSWAKWPKGVV